MIIYTILKWLSAQILTHCESIHKKKNVFVFRSSEGRTLKINIPISYSNIHFADRKSHHSSNKKAKTNIVKSREIAILYKKLKKQNGH